MQSSSQFLTHIKVLPVAFVHAISELVDRAPSVCYRHGVRKQLNCRRRGKVQKLLVELSPDMHRDGNPYAFGYTLSLEVAVQGVS